MTNETLAEESNDQTQPLFPEPEPLAQEVELAQSSSEREREASSERERQVRELQAQLRTWTNALDQIVAGYPESGAQTHDPYRMRVEGIRLRLAAVQIELESYLKRPNDRPFASFRSAIDRDWRALVHGFLDLSVDHPDSLGEEPDRQLQPEVPPAQLIEELSGVVGLSPVVDAVDEAPLRDSRADVEAEPVEAQGLEVEVEKLETVSTAAVASMTVELLTRPTLIEGHK